jgi:hypothetical protein
MAEPGSTAFARLDDGFRRAGGRFSPEAREALRRGRSGSTVPMALHKTDTN